MRIGVDVDDTISDTYEVAFAYAQKYTVEELKRSAEIQNFTAKHHYYLTIMHNWTDEEEMNFWHKYYGDIIKKVKPFTFAVDTIKKLKEEGHEIVIVTARWPEGNCDVYGLTLEWLKKNDIIYDDIVFNASDKSKVALEKKLDVFIDDSFKNCISVANIGVKAYIIDSRTNKGLESENVTRVYSWPDVYDHLADIGDTFEVAPSLVGEGK